MESVVNGQVLSHEGRVGCFAGLEYRYCFIAVK